MFLHTTSGNFVEGGEVYIKQEWPQPAHLATNLSTYTTYQPQAKHDVTVYIYTCTNHIAYQPEKWTFIPDLRTYRSQFLPQLTI